MGLEDKTWYVDRVDGEAVNKPVLRMRLMLLTIMTYVPLSDEQETGKEAKIKSKIDP